MAKKNLESKLGIDRNAIEKQIEEQSRVFEKYDGDVLFDNLNDISLAISEIFNLLGRNDYEIVPKIKESNLIGPYPKPATYLEYIYGIAARIAMLNTKICDFGPEQLEEKCDRLEKFVGKLYKEIIEEKHLKAKLKKKRL